MAGSNGTQTDVKLRDNRWLEEESKKPRMAKWEIELFAWGLTILLLVAIFTASTHVLDWIKTLRATR